MILKVALETRKKGSKKWSPVDIEKVLPTNDELGKGFIGLEEAKTLHILFDKGSKKKVSTSSFIEADLSNLKRFMQAKGIPADTSLVKELGMYPVIPDSSFYKLKEKDEFQKYLLKSTFEEMQRVMGVPSLHPEMTIKRSKVSKREEELSYIIDSLPMGSLYPNWCTSEEVEDCIDKIEDAEKKAPYRSNPETSLKSIFNWMKSEEGKGMESRMVYYHYIPKPTNRVALVAHFFVEGRDTDREILWKPLMDFTIKDIGMDLLEFGSSIDPDNAGSVTVPIRGLPNDLRPLRFDSYKAHIAEVVSVGSKYAPNGSTGTSINTRCGMDNACCSFVTESYALQRTRENEGPRSVDITPPLIGGIPILLEGKKAYLLEMFFNPNWLTKEEFKEAAEKNEYSQLRAIANTFLAFENEGINDIRVLYWFEDGLSGGPINEFDFMCDINLKIDKGLEEDEDDWDE